MSQFKLTQLLLLISILGVAACSKPDIKISHSPVVATSSEQVTFTATSDTDSSDFEIQILVNATIVKTCTSSPCVYTGGPYPAYEGTTVSFLANITDNDCSDNCFNTDGYNYFGITDSGYLWDGKFYAPARITGSTADKEDLMLHMSSDYTDNGEDYTTFLSQVGDKIYDVLYEQDIVEDNMDKMNVWVSLFPAESADCGTVSWIANLFLPPRDDDGVLHWENFQDCTNAGLSHFSAEGSNTKAFLHEAGHAVFGLGDEYCGPTGYFEPAVEPNIWATETSCRAEQSAKGRDPDECYEFCNLSGGWWGIHQGTTVMVNGMVGDPWYTEAEEHVNWFFNQL